MTAEESFKKIAANWYRYLPNWGEWLVSMGEKGPAMEARPPLIDTKGHREVPVQRSLARHYAMTSLFLFRCHKYLTEHDCEEIHLVTGLQLADTFALTDIVRFGDAKRSPTDAFADPLETRRALNAIEGYGLRCGGLFHSHPGTGPNSVTPSPTDLENQRIWEQAYPLVGAIFSRDAHVRFFTAKDSVAFGVQGKRVRRLDERLFKLDVRSDI